jgi:RNA recognition motif-containing protein
MNTVLLIDRLPLSIGGVDIRNLCLPFGAVRWSVISRAAPRALFRFGYVEMVDEDGAARAQTALHGMVLGGARLRVNRLSVTLRRTFGP